MNQLKLIVILISLAYLAPNVHASDKTTDSKSYTAGEYVKTPYGLVKVRRKIAKGVVEKISSSVNPSAKPSSAITDKEKAIMERRKVKEEILNQIDRHAYETAISMIKEALKAHPKDPEFIEMKEACERRIYKSEIREGSMLDCMIRDKKEFEEMNAEKHRREAESILLNPIRPRNININLLNSPVESNRYSSLDYLSPNLKPVIVDAYTKKNGTSVGSYRRSLPSR